MTKPKSPFTRAQLLPQEETLEVSRQRGELFIGIPKEAYFQEKRICLTPDAVNAIVNNGHRVLIENGAGDEAGFSDKDYSEAGAQLTNDTKKVFGCPMVLKVEPPTLEELELINPKTVLISALQLKTRQKSYFDALAKKKITALAFEFIKDEDHSYPAVKALSEIAGTASVLIAAELMVNAKKGNGLLFGSISGVPPIEVVVIGAGTVGEFAVRSALGLGASVKVFDSSIGAVRGHNRAPIIVTEEMVRNMKKGAVIIDVCVDMGGCFETTEMTSHDNPTFIKHEVIHYGVPNIPARYPKTASISISNIFTPYILEIAESGGLENAIRFDNGLKNGLYFYRGILTNKACADWFNMSYSDINLLIF